MNAKETAAKAAAYLREEADYNRSWVDGRRGVVCDGEYAARRLALAEERDAWAKAIEKLIEVTR